MSKHRKVCSSSKGSRLSDNLCAKIAHNWQFVLMIGILMHAIDVCNGHGRLIEPPSRSSAFRYGFQTPPNYNDHELYCGGFARQQKNGGKCGECGDAWGKTIFGENWKFSEDIREIKLGNLIDFLELYRYAGTETKWIWWQIWTRRHRKEI